MVSTPKVFKSSILCISWLLNFPPRKWIRNVHRAYELDLRSFPQRVKMNLHMVLVMSPAGESFRSRCRMNPSLVNCCTIDWYSDWTDDAMLEVANVYLDDCGLKRVSEVKGGREEVNGGSPGSQCTAARAQG